MTLSKITNYIEDDWGDNKLQNRDNSGEGYFLHPSDNLLSGDYEAGDMLIGRYRPEWVIDNPSGASNPYTSSGQLVFPMDESGGDGWLWSMVETPASFTTGIWQLDFRMAVDQSGGGDQSGNYPCGMFPIADGDGNTSRNGSYWEVRADDEETFYDLEKTENGADTTIISATWGSAPDGNWHTMKTLRDSYGVWEILKDGSSAGTGTDIFLPEVNFFYAGGRTNDGRWSQTFYFDNLVIQ